MSLWTKWLRAIPQGPSSSPRLPSSVVMVGCAYSSTRSKARLARRLLYRFRQCQRVEGRTVVSAGSPLWIPHQEDLTGAVGDQCRNLFEKMTASWRDKASVGCGVKARSASRASTVWDLWMVLDHQHPNHPPLVTASVLPPRPTLAYSNKALIGTWVHRSESADTTGAGWPPTALGLNLQPNTITIQSGRPSGSAPERLARLFAPTRRRAELAGRALEPARSRRRRSGSPRRAEPLVRSRSRSPVLRASCARTRARRRNSFRWAASRRGPASAVRRATT
jgi:hypothetical protein